MMVRELRTIILYCVVAEAQIYLYARYVKTRSKNLAVDSGEYYSDVMYQSFILESYEGFTNLIYIVTLFLFVLIGLN